MIISFLIFLLGIVKLNDGCTSLTMSQDITFIMDSSSYLSTSQWEDTRDFVNGLLNSVANSGNYGISVFRYGDETIAEYSEDASFATRQTAQTTLGGLAQFKTSISGTSKPDPSTVINYAINELSVRSSERRRVILLIASEESVLDVCNRYPRENNVFFYVITVNDGSWYSNFYDCLATTRSSNSDSIQTVSSHGSLSSLSSSTLDLLCPSDPIVKVTEVKADTGGSRPAFVEMYNYGPDINMQSTSITLSPLITNSIQSDTSLTWSQGTYLVVYNDDATLNCDSCVCTQTSGYCDDAFYIRCGASSATVGNYDASCSFSNSYSYSNWQVTLAIGGTTIETITYGSGGSWSSGTSQYSYSLKFSIWDPQYGSSWARSTDVYGTPGEEYTLTADTGLTCSSGEYHNYQTCDTAPLPSNCVGTITDATSGSSSAEYEFDLAPYDGHHWHTGLYCPNNVGNCDTPSTQTLVGNFEEIDEDIAYTPIQIGLYDKGWYEEPTYSYVACTRVSMSPTNQPSASPTYSTPIVGSCSIDVDIPTDNTFTVTWSETRGGNAPPTGSQYYTIYLDAANPLDAYYPLATQIYPQNYDPTSSTVTMTVTYEDVDGVDYISGTTECTTITTSEPTKRPTGNPTMNPLADVTNNPSVQPTPSPTYDDIDVDSCIITIIPGQTSQAYVNWTTTPAFDVDDTAEEDETFFILTYPGGSVTVFTFETTGVVKTFSPALVSSDTATLTAYWYIADPLNGLESGQSAIDFTCTITSTVPTMTPSNVPSMSPTPKPTTEPTPAPTGQPTRFPTASPTFVMPVASPCNVTVTNGDTLYTSVFQLIDISTPNTPSNDSIRYRIDFPNNDFTQRLHNAITCIDSSDPCFASFDGSFASGSYNSTVPNYPTLTVQYLVGSTVQQSSTPVVCDIFTEAPSNAPSEYPSKAPTKAPLTEETYIYFELDMCDQSGSDRCGCLTYDDCSSSGNYDYAPMMVVSEAESPVKTSIPIRRSDSIYRYNISLTYSIYFVNQSFSVADRNNFTRSAAIYTNQIGEFNYSIPESNFAPEREENKNQGTPGVYTDDVQTETFGTARDTSWIDQTFVYKSDVISADLELGIYTEDYTSTLKSTDYYQMGEVIMIELTDCFVHPAPSIKKSGDVRNCSLVWPSRIFVVIDDADPVVPGKKKSVKNDSWEDWFWYVLIAIAVFLLVLGYFVYRWWVNNKMKEAEVEEEEDKIDEHFREIEDGFGGDLDNTNVGVNPLNTDVQRMKNQGKNVMGTDTGTNNTAIQDRAEVRVDKINFKQEFGPNTGNRYE